MDSGPPGPPDPGAKKHSRIPRYGPQEETGPGGRFDHVTLYTSAGFGLHVARTFIRCTRLLNILIRFSEVLNSPTVAFAFSFLHSPTKWSSGP
jgi:hypothetical protein